MAKSRDKAQLAKSSSSYKQQAADRTDKEEESSDEDLPPTACHYKKVKQPSKTDEEVDDDWDKPEIEVVDEKDTTMGEPTEVQDSDKVSGYHYQGYFQHSHQ